MKYDKPEVTNPTDAIDVIQSNEKSQQVADGDQGGILGTVGAYQADE